MAHTDKELLQKLLATFKVEAEEHISAISTGLVELEAASSPEKQMETIETVFREAHNLKGAARVVNSVKIEALCQFLESLFARLKSREMALSPEIFDQLHQTVDTLGAQLSPGSSETAAASELDLRPPETREPAEAPAERPRTREEKRGLSETVRVPASKLDSLLCQAEELVPAKATAVQRVAELCEIRQALLLWESEWRKVRAQAHALPLLSAEHASQGHEPSSNGHAAARSRITKISSFLSRNESHLGSISQRVSTLVKHLEYDHRALDRRVDDLVEEMKRVSMLPFSALLESFPKLVRDLSRDCGKDTDLTIEGGEIETDRRILEEMKDPIIHLIRNCIDHGIESPMQRDEIGKPGRATIRIAISPKSADKVEIVVSDDGAGVDIQKVRAAAIKLALISREDAAKMDQHQTASLIFKSGISTSPMITEVSGRGLGLAIVREKAERVGGTVSLETKPGRGTTFRLMLPLTLARFRGIFVRVGESLFVLPTRHVQRVIRLSRDEIKSAENRETIQIDGRAVSAVRLADVLEIAQRNDDADPKRKVPVLVVGWAGEQIGFLVDEILDEQEILVKSLGKQLPRVRNIAGATVVGTGKVLPVLEVADLMQSAVRMTPVNSARETVETAKSILVAEDSITARTLLKNILEFAGYKVKAVIDGMEALTALATGGFDLVVSDVEMPRMGGFDLTAKIRADARFSELPVVLVTALDSRADRERGVDAGANAYIVKSGFDQGNLLEVIGRLI